MIVFVRTLVEVIKIKKFRNQTQGFQGGELEQPPGLPCT